MQTYVSDRRSHLLERILSFIADRDDLFTAGDIDRI